MFHENGYPTGFFDKAVQNSLTLNKKIMQQQWQNITLPFLRKASRKLVKNLAKLFSELSNVKIIVVCKTFKDSNYFHLKSRTP